MKYLFILFFTLSILGFGQTEIEKANKDFNGLLNKKELTEKEQVKFYELSLVLAENDPQSLLKVAKEGEKKLKKYKNYSALANYIDNVNVAYIFVGEPEKGVQESERLYKELEDELNNFLKVQFKLNKVRYLDMTNQSQKSIKLIEELLKLSTQELQISMLKSIKASSNVKLGNYKEASENYYEALELYQKIGYTRNVIVTYNQLGRMFQNIGDDANAKKYFIKAMQLAETNKMRNITTATYLNMGILHGHNDELDSAMYYLDRHLELLKDSHNITDLAKHYLNRATIYIKQKKYTEAENAISVSMEICKENKLTEGIVYNYNALFDLYMSKKDYNQAKSAIDSSLYYAKQTDLKDFILSNYKNQANLYKSLNNYKKAFENLELYYNLYEEVFGEEKQKTIAELEIKYKSELKDQEIAQINQILEIQQARNSYLIIAIASIIGIMGLISYILISRNKSLKTIYVRNIEMMNNMQYITSDVSQKENTTEENPVEEILPENSVNLKKVFDRLLNSLEIDKIYTNPNLSLSDTSNFVNSNDKYVSQAIAEYANMNYSNFINFYRINEAKIMIYENHFNNLNEVSYACGFNSRTTFYNAFKKHTGLSPKQFKDMTDKKEEIFEMELKS